MILSDGQILDSLKFNALIQDQATRYQYNLPLRFLNRCATTPADDDEITATFTGTVFAAPLVADDQKAPVYEAGTLEYVTNTIPNIKIGKRFSQRMINRLNLIKRNLGAPGIRGETAMFTNWEVQAAKDLIRGVDEQKNNLICAMLIDSMSYDNLGIKIVGNWGTPSDLKATPSTLWTSTSATPITDILTMKFHAANTYGEVYDRVTMPMEDFLNAVATTEFKNLLQGIVLVPLASTAFNTFDPRMSTYFSQMLQMDVELEAKIITTQNNNGSKTVGRVLPLGKVLLTTKSDDKDATAFDFGNAVVTEALVAGLVGDPDNMPSGNLFGPIGYYTGAEDMNPPNLTAWAVARGFPRKNRKTMNAVLTVR